MTTKRSSGAVTADDVAALAGVSRWTVNRAFKADASISAKSRDKVMRAAGELGYEPDLLAASLASDRSNLVSLLIDDFANPHKLVMMERLTRILGQNGWDTLLVNTRSEDDAAAALRAAGQRRVDAAVLIGSSFNDAGLQAALGARRVVKLVVFARYSHNPGTLSICVDDEAAMAMICDHVLERGYTNPFFLAGPQTESAHVSRKQTFLARWSAAKGERPDFAAVDVYDPKRAFDLVSQRFLDQPSPDVIVCENDALAMGAIDAIRHVLKRRVPEDIAVTGFDDVPQASNPNYRLTTFRQPISAMAEAVVALLKGEDADKELSSFKGTLIVRESA